VSARVLVVDGAATVRRVVRRTLEEVGHSVEEASDPSTGLAVAQHFVPTLVLLDPDGPPTGALDAAGLCKALRGISNLQQVPIVLMTAGDSEAALERTGASDALRKPFGRDALLTAVAHALEPKNDTGAFEAIGPEDPHPAADAIRTHLADWLVALVPDAAASIGAALERLEPGDLFAKVEELARRLPDHPEEGELSFHGRLEHVGLGDVLQILQHQAQSGVLVVRSFDGKAISLCLSKGTVDLVLARGTPVDLRLGRYIVAEGLMDQDELAPLLQRAGQGLLGRRLMKLGSVTEEELKRALARQSSELVYEALRWPRGTFSFSRFAKRPEADEAALGLPMTSILMEGLRRVDEWRLIEEQIDSFDRVPLIDVDVVRETPRERMQPAERTVLDAVDGRRTIRELIEHTKLGAFEVCKVLYQLLGSRLIRLR
jgi:CheY-like chemotaxis protein